MIMIMMIVLIIIYSRPPLYGYHADTSLSRTVFFVPGESPYDFLQIQPALCGHLLMWTTQWTLVSCQINRFSWNVNLANADSSFSPCAVINLSLFKIKKNLRLKVYRCSQHFSTPNRMNRGRQFRTILHQKSYAGNDFD